MKNSFMKKNILILIAFIFVCTTVFGQTKNGKTMFVVDSIPVINDPGYFNEILQEDIANISVIKNKDSLKILGLLQFDSVTYIFTKEYRNRPDSIKRIPSRKQMEVRNDTCFFQGIPYSGQFIDYYCNGRRQFEGTCFNGSWKAGVNPYKSYYRNGNLLRKTSFRNHENNFSDSLYYLNGALYSSTVGVGDGNGKHYNIYKLYYINGQVASTVTYKNDIQKGEMYLDTGFQYNSSGRLIEKYYVDSANRKMISSIGEINMLMAKWYTYFEKKDYSEAEKCCSKAIKLDNTYADAYMKRGRVELAEFNYKAAIADCDKALELEPFLLETTIYRAYAQVQKNERETIQKLTNNFRDFIPPPKSYISLTPYKAPVIAPYILHFSQKEKKKLCNDLQEAEQVCMLISLKEVGFNFVIDALLKYCNIKSNL